ncbi:DUF1294 domain-containing protein [Coraliomargarita algicola]|uniref:DUF1294 domain-containing protein n=1 Tax=Coraliomargarita algicola TaxID=3092156 RepID=A0ABZ0RIG1_9BACT|nr:DUF1294 domain-containing protein [Coraliomargarita sp. J2-16]WPJ95307.1 DUF1294 domain-containing protein [Coraliomargarita sp. J2-16]
MKRHIPILVCGILPLVGLYKLSANIDWQFILGYWLFISVTTFVSYWQDKRRAQKGLWRIPEKSLHSFELLGGWPAAYLAQQLFRHKTSKRSFRIAFWCIVGFYQFLALEWITDWRVSRWLISLV